MNTSDNSYPQQQLQIPQMQMMEMNNLEDSADLVETSLDFAEANVAVKTIPLYS